MEGKTVIFSVLLPSLVMAQIQVDANYKSCCPSTTERNLYDVCRLKFDQISCAILCGCKLSDTKTSTSPAVQVEAKSCCPSTLKRNCYNVCRLKFSQGICKTSCGCKIVDGTCPPGWEKDVLENSGDAINEYCKLGCASYICDAITTLQASGEEIVNKAVEQYTNACSEFCTKGSTTSALEIA